MKILFIGNTSTRARYECGVKGDGASETLEFDLAAVQDGFDLAACAASLLLAAKGESYGDKITLDAATDGERVIATYVLPAKVTRLGAVSAQLLFEAGEASWRTRQFDLEFSPAVEWDEKIAEGYPDALERIEATADEAKATADATAELVGTFDERITVLEGDVEGLLGKDFSNLTGTIHEIEENAATETAARKAGDEALKEALEAETEARKEADAGLDERVTALENTSFDGLADAVHSNTETAREALKIANQATDDLAQEIADRESACEALQGALTDATATLDKSIEDAETRLTEALTATESELQKAIDEETEARKSADETLTENLAAEIQLRTEADAALTQSIAEETAAREAADDALREALTEASDEANQAIKDAESALTASIESEAAERKAADDALTASIESATASLTASIESEANERKEADEKLSSDIATAQEAAVEAAKEYADGVSLDITESADTYVFTFALRNGEKGLSTASIDLPLEEMIISGHYDATAKEIVLTLRTGQTITFSVSDLVEGLVNDGDLDEAVTGLEAKIASALADAEGYADTAVNAETAAREASEGALSEAIEEAKEAADAAQKTADEKIDKDAADGLYQPIGDYATKAEADALDGRLTDAEKDIEELKAGVKVDLSDYYTKEQTDALVAARMTIADVDAIFE